MNHFKNLKPVGTLKEKKKKAWWIRVRVGAQRCKTLFLVTTESQGGSEGGGLGGVLCPGQRRPYSFPVAMDKLTGR